MDELTQRLTLCILHSQLSVRQLAEAIGQCPSTVYGWMKGRSTPGAHSLKGICEALGVSADWLLGLAPGGGGQYE